MFFMALGLNYQTAPSCIRSKLAFDADEAIKLGLKLREVGLAVEAMIVSTCNRTELYSHLNHADQINIVSWLAKECKLALSDLQPYVYSYSNLSAVRHLLRVASGLDSMVLGEVEILGQIKTAYRRAMDAGSLGKYLDRLFQFTFSAAKQIRTQTGIGVNPVSVASLAVRLASQIFSHLQEATVLLIGAGNLMRVTAEHLQATGVRKILLANRTPTRPQIVRLASRIKAETISLEMIPAHLAQADIVITGTASVLPILGKGLVERAVKIRKHRPIYMVDLAMPPDIEPEVGGLEDVYLYTLDDLQAMAKDNFYLRKEAATLAEERVLAEAEQFMGYLRSKPAFTVVKELQFKYQETREEVLTIALQQLKRGKSPEIILQHALHRLTNRLLHTPTKRLRLAGVEEETELLIQARELFDLP